MSHLRIMGNYTKDNVSSTSHNVLRVADRLTTATPNDT